ncbi:MAG: AsmA family protein, partial [Burkholderiales bacterium]
MFWPHGVNVSTIAPFLLPMRTFLNRAPRFLLAFAITLLLLLGGAVLALRYWFLPNIEDYRGRIAQAASTALGQEVEIGGLAAQWRGPRLHLVLTDVTVLDGANSPALTLGQVDTTLGWMSLLSGDVKLYSLNLNGPRLQLERGQNGAIRIVGFKETDGHFGDWLLAQESVIVSDAEITWRDLMRNAPAIVLSDIDLTLENSGADHRFGLQASPPVEVASRLNMRGEVNGRALADVARWQGELYGKLDRVNLPALRTWIDLPIDLTEGAGAVTAWIKFRDQRLESATADLALANVKTKIGADLA